MIDSSEELRVAVRNLRIMETTLAALRQQLQTTNPDLLAVTSKAYVRRIGDLQSDIAQYLGYHPEAVSSILPPLEMLVADPPSVPTA
jgi:hypothetical protein